jgi:hypothetical protein
MAVRTMPNSISRVERYRDRAEECRRLANLTRASEISDHYAQVAQDYLALAEAEERFAKASPSSGNE